jgi:hypothetical protein
MTTLTVDQIHNAVMAKYRTLPPGTVPTFCHMTRLIDDLLLETPDVALAVAAQMFPWEYSIFQTNYRQVDGEKADRFCLNPGARLN